MTALLLSAPALPSPDTPADDWDVLFSAVIARLRRIVDDPQQAGSERSAQDAAACVRAGVLQCVEALGQLQRLAGHRGLPPGGAL